VLSAVKALQQAGIFDRIAGGFPHNFHAVRRAVEALDPLLKSSPLKGSAVRRRLLEGPKKDGARANTDNEDDDEHERPSKKSKLG
jgi:hypothetical protein